MNTPLPKPEDLSQSTAGEEDPGAAMDVVAATPPAGMKPCPDCGATGQRAGGPCATCQGTGKVSRDSAQAG
jgi:hypothetical protein